MLNHSGDRRFAYLEAKNSAQAKLCAEKDPDLQKGIHTLILEPIAAREVAKARALRGRVLSLK